MKDITAHLNQPNGPFPGQEAYWSVDLPTWQRNYIKGATERVLNRNLQTLQNRPQLWLEVIHHATDAVLIFEPIAENEQDPKIIFANPAFTTMTGYTASDILSLSPRILLGPNTDQNQLHRIQETFEHWQSIQVELINYRKDKSEFWVEIHLHPIADEEGIYTHWLSIQRDITERKLAEIKAQKQAQREQLLNTVTLKIRQSLDLMTTLNTTVSEVHRLLATDRVVIYRFTPDWHAEVVVESVDPTYGSSLGIVVQDTCFHDRQGAGAYQKGWLWACNDVYQAGLTPCHLALLTRFNVRANLVVPILQGQHLWGLLIMHQCDGPRIWEDYETALLRQLADQIGIAIYQSELYEKSQFQIYRLSLLNQIVQDMRKSLDKSEILQRTVELVQIAFQSSIANVGLCCPTDAYFNSVHTASAPGTNSFNHQIIPVSGNPHAQYILTQETPVATHDVTNCPHMSPMLDLAQELNVKAMLAVAIRNEDEVLGILGVQQCDRTRYWTHEEQSFIKQVADQLAVAIIQGRLYEQIKHQAQQLKELNQALEVQVKQRTSELQQALDFEAVLKRITDKVRDSLDEKQILQTAVKELALILEAEICRAVLYDSLLTQATVHYEYQRLDSPSILGEVFLMENYPEIFGQLQEQRAVQMVHPQGMLLLCSIFDNQEIMGHVAVINAGQDFSDPQIRLVQQVANQCAIALRQARLYQSSQAQVQELERLAGLKNDFLSTVSHELRTPVSNMKMSIYMLKNASEDRRSLYMEILEQECQREIQLINDLLDLQQIESNKPLVLRPIMLQNWIPQVISPFINRSQESQQNLELILPPDLPPIISDKACLERIIAELLNNACKYTPPHEIISLELKFTAHSLDLIFTNTGVEIPEDELSHVFEKFYRIPSADPWQRGGTGLGLALVQKLVSRLEGTIVLHSKDYVTQFIVHLPHLNVPSKEAFFQPE